MKLLIIDDNIDKVNKLVSTIVSTGAMQINDIKVCSNLVDAKKELISNKYDALLLDMQLPVRDGQIAKSNAGIEFLQHFKNNSKYHHPREIIGITEFEHEFDAAKEIFDNNLLHIIHYSETTDNWKDKLLERLEYLASSEDDELEYDCDVAIICALNSPELDAVKFQVKDWDEHKIHKDKSTKYYTCNINGLKTVVASAAQMGMPASTALAMKIIAFFKPKYLFMSGICAGVYEKVNIGDILVADQSWDYGSGKIKGNGETQIFQVEPYALRLTPELKANVEVLQSNHVILANIKNQWQGAKPENSLTIHIGPIVSGSAVVADKSIIEKLLAEQHRKLIGIEMEGYGVMYAAEHSPDPKPKVMIVKSVCDFGDIEKDDKYQAYAAYTSASFIYEYMNLYCHS